MPRGIRVFSDLENLVSSLVTWLSTDGMTYHWRLREVTFRMDNVAIVTVINGNDERFVFALFNADNEARMRI